MWKLMAKQKCKVNDHIISSAHGNWGNKNQQTSFISCHISFAVMPCEFPDIKKQGHSEIRTASVSCAAIAKVTGGSPSVVLYQ